MARLAPILAAALWLAASAARDAAAEARPPYGGEVTASLWGEPASLDPVLARSESEIALAGLLFDTLYRIDDLGRAVPHVAASFPEPVADAGAYRIALREQVLYHDGTEMTPDDVARSIERARASSAGWMLAPVRAVWADADAIVIESARGVVPLELLLASPIVAITPGGRPPQERRVIGSGPFELAALARDRRVVEVRAFEQHFAGRPYVDAITLRWFLRAAEEARRYEAGGAHLSLRGEAAFSGNRPRYETRVAEGAAATLTYVGFGRQVPILADSLTFRRALSLAIGRRGFRAIGAGERVIPAVTPTPPDLGGPAIDADLAWARPAEAEALWRRAANQSPALGALMRDDGAPSLEVLVDASRPEDRLVAEKVVAALFGLGLRAHVAEAPAAELARRARRGECTLYIGQLAAPLPSAKLQLAAALAAGRRASDAARVVRGALDAEGALARFDAQLPIVPLFHRAQRVHHRADLYGLSFDRAGRAQYADLFFFGEPAVVRRRGR
jgi:ABC-type transport system substrate-binding protein